MTVIARDEVTKLSRPALAPYLHIPVGEAISNQLICVAR